MAEKRYWDGEWPNLNSISMAFTEDAKYLSPAAMGILHRLAWFCASRGVYSFYKPNPQPMCFPNNDPTIIRISGSSPEIWNAEKDEVLAFFVLSDGNWFLKDESIIRLSRDSGRMTLASASKMAAQGRGIRCVYCGDEDGPFDHDHLFPLSKGGTDEPNNIVLACARCNRSKGAKSLMEWMAFMRDKHG